MNLKQLQNEQLDLLLHRIIEKATIFIHLIDPTNKKDLKWKSL